MSNMTLDAINAQLKQGILRACSLEEAAEKLKVPILKTKAQYRETWGDAVRPGITLGRSSSSARRRCFCSRTTRRANPTQFQRASTTWRTESKALVPSMSRGVKLPGLRG